jgi:hypothetical protein
MHGVKTQAPDYLMWIVEVKSKVVFLSTIVECLTGWGLGGIDLVD